MTSLHDIEDKPTSQLFHVVPDLEWSEVSPQFIKLQDISLIDFFSFILASWKVHCHVWMHTAHRHLNLKSSQHLL